MNLYVVVIHQDHVTGVYGEKIYVSARSARDALTAAYAKFDKKYPNTGVMVVHSLDLIQEKW